MKKIYSKAVLFVVLLIFCLTKSILAQTYQQEADQVMQPLNKTYVTTGILYDRVFPLAYLQGYKGISTDDTTNSDHLWFCDTFQTGNYRICDPCYSA